MSSAAQKLLSQIRNQRASLEQYKSLPEVPKATRLPCHNFTTAKCKQFDNSKKILYTVVVHYTIGSTKYYSYLPSEYQNESEKIVKETAATLNTAVSKGETLDLVYYGQTGGSNRLDLLGKDENFDMKTLEDCRAEELPESPNKKQRVE